MGDKWEYKHTLVPVVARNEDNRDGDREGFRAGDTRRMSEEDWELVQEIYPGQGEMAFLLFRRPLAKGLTHQPHI